MNTEDYSEGRVESIGGRLARVSDEHYKRVDGWLGENHLTMVVDLAPAASGVETIEEVAVWDNNELTLAVDHERGVFVLHRHIYPDIEMPEDVRLILESVPARVMEDSP